MLASYQEVADDISLEQFVLKYSFLVKKIAYHIKCRLPNHIEIDDIIQSGIVGLLEARQNFKANMDACFETFAGIRIRGAIIDGLRKNSWLTRSHSKNMRMINDAIDQIEAKVNRKATHDEIAAYLGISVDEYLKIAHEINHSQMVSIDDVEPDSIFFSDDNLNPFTVLQDESTRQHLKNILKNLPEKQQILLSLYYVEELSFKQIGAILNLTEARICQLHKQALSLIQTRLRFDNSV